MNYCGVETAKHPAKAFLSMISRTRSSCKVTLAEYGFRARSHGSIRMDVLTEGLSCHAVLVEDTAQGNVVLKQALPRLKVATEWKSDVARIRREALCMRHLREIGLGDNVPQLLWEDHTEHVIIMTEVRRPHENWREQLLRGDLSMGIARQFAMLRLVVDLGVFRRELDVVERTCEARRKLGKKKEEPRAGLARPRRHGRDSSIRSPRSFRSE